MKEKLLIKVLLVGISLAFASCRKSEVENACISPLPNASPTRALSPAPLSNFSIREVDFDNFTYQYPNLPGENFTLINGRQEQTEDRDGAILGKIEYGDVTGEGEEDAMLRILPVTGGNCQCEMAFVYAMQNNQPKLLWSFDTDDRAQGGLKRLYAENSKLVVETFGDNKFENGNWEFKFPKKITGYCCPTAYTRIRFKWNGEKFAAEGEPELFDYDWKKEMSSRRSENK